MTKPTGAELMVARSSSIPMLLVYAQASDAPINSAPRWPFSGKRLCEGRRRRCRPKSSRSTANVALKSSGYPVQVRAQLDLYEQFEVIQSHPAIIRVGLDLHQTRSIGCGVLFSEDMNTGEVIGGVRIVNPFANLSAV
ncbi:MAG: twitching motility protein PilT [Rhodoferax sp.]|nr:twitching motility protein PilT [Rhodoferax sp.]